MNPKFPLNDVMVRRVETTRRVEDPLYTDNFWQINQNEFAMQVDGVGDFYACNGCEVEYSPVSDATLASVELYLNGSVYGAILHQRHILPMNGSSFVWNNQAIMVCGESGAGKSSLTAAFCREGAQFLTDDVTPLTFTHDLPQILALSDRIKLWDDSLDQMGHDSSDLHQILPGQQKYYFPMEKGKMDAYPLHSVFILEVSQQGNVEFTPLEGVAAFTALRNEVYRWEYLPAMPATEAAYLEELLILSQKAEVFRVKRPVTISISEMQKLLAREIEK